MSRLKAAFVAALALLLVGVLADAASAHVTVSSPNAQQGGYSVITFRMPDESASAAAVKLQVEFPTDTPFASVAVQPHPGWNYTLTRGKLPKPITTDDGDQVTEAITGVTWTATGGGVKPDEFDQFDVSVGPLPNASSLQFRAIQTYSDGTVVRWVEQPAANGAEPEHPAPTLALSPAGATNGTAGPATAPGKADDASDTSTTLAVTALVVAILGLLAGLAALVAARRSTATRG